PGADEIASLDTLDPVAGGRRTAADDPDDEERGRDRRGETGRESHRDGPPPSALGPLAEPEPSEEVLEPADLRIRRTAAVPQVVVVVLAHPDPPWAILSRRSFIPRCRLTRTDPWVIPVREAISGPVIPSTRRRIKVSR